MRKKIDQSLKAFLEQTKEEYKLHLVSPILYESIMEFSLRKGKRIRPLLLILSYMGYTKEKTIPSSLYNASTCIELLHNFMLIHDDIIDRSDLRRGKPTLHKLLGKTLAHNDIDQDRLGYDLAIIAGDIVYAMAIDAFLCIEEEPKRKEKALKYFIQTAAFTAMGEFIDTVKGVDKLSEVSEEDVLLNYSLKTARYTFDCPLVTGAILAGAPEEDIAKLAKLGLHVGQAFQIQDDIIGIFGTEQKIGKSILSDLTESKKTLLVTHAYSALNQEGKQKFEKIFNRPNNSEEDLFAIQKIFVETKSLHYCLEEIKKRTDKTLDILKTLQMNSTHLDIIKESIFSPFQHSDKIAIDYNIDILVHPQTSSTCKS